MALPESDLECPICFELPKKAVDCNCCHNIYCEQCAFKYKMCPTCKLSPFKFSDNVPVRRMIDRIRVRCKYCNDVVPRGEQEMHMRYCKEQGTR